MTRRWFSKLITAAPVASKVLSDRVFEETPTGGLTQQFYGPSLETLMAQQQMEVQKALSMAKSFRPTPPKSEHYKFLEKTLRAYESSKRNMPALQFPYRKIHNCNPGYIPQASGVQQNKQRFRLRYQSPGEKFARDRAVKLWNLRRKTTLAEEWEAAKNEIMEACSIEL